MNKYNIPMIRAWYDPEHKWYELFLPDGTPFPAVTEVRISKIDDNFEEPTTAIFRAVVEIVNEKPQ